MSNKGFIQLPRSVLDEFLWQERREYSKFEAWLDIVMFARWSDEPTEVVIGNAVYTVKRGEQIRSLRTLSTTWNWNISKVRRFLKMIENRHRVVTKSDTQTTRISICDFDTYQPVRNANETQMTHERNANEKQMNTIEEGNKGKKVKKVSKSYSDDFEEAWVSYRRKGGKKAAFQQWENLSQEEKNKAKSHIPRYVSTRELTYQKDFEKYLKDGHYESDVMGNNPMTPQATQASLYD